MKNHNKHALANYGRLLWICVTSFLGGALLFVGFSSFILKLWKFKRAQIFLFNWWRGNWKEGIPFLFHLFALCADWTLVALTAGFKKKCFLGKGDKEGRKEKGRNPKKRRILNTSLSTILKFNSWLECISTSPWSLIRFLSLKSLLLICAKCLMLRDHSEYHLLDSPRNQQSNFLHFFPLFKKFCLSVFGFTLKSLPFLPITQAQGWKMKLTSNVKHHFYFVYVEELICNSSSSAL